MKSQRPLKPLGNPILLSMVLVHTDHKLTLSSVYRTIVGLKIAALHLELREKKVMMFIARAMRNVLC